MSRNLPSIIAGIVLILFLGLYMITFQVRSIEVAIVSLWGEIDPPGEDGQSDDVKTAGGLYWKWPWPIQKEKTMDNRVQISSTVGEETPTRDGKSIIVTTSVAWRIGDPYEFSIRSANREEAEKKLLDRIRSDQKTVIGQYDFANFVSTDPNELRYDEIESAILSKVQKSVTDEFGIQVEWLGIEELELPPTITQQVFEAMKKERLAVAAQYTTEGESEAARIKATAQGIADTILSFADRRAEEIRAEGVRRAAKEIEVFRENPGLATFLISLENLPKLFGEGTTWVLPADHPILKAIQPEGMKQEDATRVEDKKRTESTTASGTAPLPVPVMELATPR